MNVEEFMASRPRDEQVLKPPPHSAEAEQSVIGALLLNNAAIDQVAGLLPQHFFVAFNAAIYAECCAMIVVGDTADVVTLFERMRAKAGMFGEREGLLAYLNELSQCVPTAASAGRYAKIVRDRATERALILASYEVQDIAYRAGPVAEKVDAAMTCMGKVGEQVIRKEPAEFADSYGRWLALAESRMAGKGAAMPTGLADLDRALAGGLRRGQVAFVGARPGMGKTAWAQTIAATMAQTQSVLFCSMEMAESDLHDRWTAMIGAIALDRVLKCSAGDADVFQAMTDTAVAMQERCLWIDDQPALTLLDVRAKCLMVKRLKGLAVVIVDYLQLMQGDKSSGSRHYELEEISRGLKAMAKDLDVAVIALVQVKRGVDEHKDGMPRMSDIRDCGSVEQDADLICFIDRPIKRKQDLGGDWLRYACMRIVKNRQGPSGIDIPLHFTGEYQRFANWDGRVPVEKPTGRGSDL
jgi:replicative DNA helicase